MKSDGAESAVHRPTRTYCRLAGRRAQCERMIGALGRSSAATQHRRARPARAAHRLHLDETGCRRPVATERQIGRPAPRPNGVGGSTHARPETRQSGAAVVKPRVPRTGGE